MTEKSGLRKDKRKDKRKGEKKGRQRNTAARGSDIGSLCSGGKKQVRQRAAADGYWP
jgi:hypothetical protein